MPLGPPSAGSTVSILVMKPALSSLSGRELAHDFGIQALGCLTPRLAQGDGSSRVVLARRRRLLGQFPGPSLAGVERGQLGLEPAQQRGQVVHRDPVLAGERAQGEQPLLGALEVFRLEGAERDRLLDLGARRVGLGQHALERLGDGGEQMRGDRGLALDPAQRRGEPRAAGALPGERIERLAKLAGELLGMHHQLPALGQTFLFAGLRIEAAKLIQRMAHIVGVGAGGGDLGLMARPLGVSLLPRGIGDSDARRLAAQSAKGVHQLAMARRVDQRPVVMLAVDLDQSLPDKAQELDTHADVVDEGPAPAIGPLHAAQDQPLLGLDAVLGQQRKYGMALGQLENRRDLALGLALAHQRGIASAADGEREGIEQDRFAGAGLPGERRQALAEFEIELVDQDDVADRQGG